MIILIDEPRKSWKWYSHMVSDNISDLHAFAEEIGVGKHMYSNKRGKNKPHYDVHKRFFDKAVTNGAVVTTSSEIVDFLNEHYK